jgi:adenylylsulfate kinase
LGLKLRSELEKRGYSCGWIDGDEFREFWGNDAGFSPEDRQRNQRNIIFTAAQSVRIFDCVIVSSLSPFMSIRDLAREKLGNFHEVYVECELEVCRKRDPKGNYARAQAGAIKNYVGVSDVYEPPINPELRVRTTSASLEESYAELARYVFGRLVLP